MARASARSAVTAAPCALQYCRSMAIDAEPQPSSVCFTYGTSSQMPGALPTGADWPRTATTQSSTPAETRSIDRFHPQRKNSVQHSHQCDHQNGDDDDDQQVAIGQTPGPSGGKTVVHLARALGQPGQVVIAERSDGPVHPAVFDSGRPQRLLRLF